MFRNLATVRSWALPGLVVLSLAGAAWAAPSVTVGLGGWFSDTFPANETPGFPGNAALFDTCAAHIRTGINTAQRTGDIWRYNIPRHPHRHQHGAEDG
jgi:hypothetical protein